MSSVPPPPPLTPLSEIPSPVAPSVEKELKVKSKINYFDLPCPVKFEELSREAYSAFLTLMNLNRIVWFETTSVTNAIGTPCK